MHGDFIHDVYRCTYLVRYGLTTGAIAYVIINHTSRHIKGTARCVISHNSLHAQNGVARRSTTSSTEPRDSKKWIIQYKPWLLGCYQQYETRARDISPSPRADISGSGLILLITTRKSWFIYYMSGDIS